MTDLMVDYIVSLDGYGAADGWPGLWGLMGPEYLAFLGEDSETEHITLMGATTYGMMAGFADQMPDDPGMADLTAMPKVVFSSRMREPLPWANTRLVSGDAVAAVRELKAGSRPLRTLGSLSLTRSLLHAGVVNRLRVVVFPVINGATGTGRLFEGWGDIALEPVQRRTFDGQLELLEYAPTVLEGPVDERAAQAAALWSSARAQEES